MKLPDEKKGEDEDAIEGVKCTDTSVTTTCKTTHSEQFKSRSCISVVFGGIYQLYTSCFTAFGSCRREVISFISFLHLDLMFLEEEEEEVME